MEIITINNAEKLETAEGIMTPLIFGDNLCLFHIKIPPNFDIPPHRHPVEVVLYFLEGEVEVTSEDKNTSIVSGTALLVGQNESIGIKNLSNKPAKAILVSSPAPVKSIEELKKLLGFWVVD